MNCPKCNTILSETDKFCPACGTPAPVSIGDDNKTQAANAFPVNGEAPQQPEPTQQYVPQQPEPPQQYVPQQSASPQEYAPHQPYSPTQPVKDFSQQYQQYQQKSQYPSTQPNGYSPKKNGNTPLIVVIIILAVLLVGGGVLAAIMIFGNNDNKGDKSTASSSAVSSEIAASGSETPDESSSVDLFGGSDSSIAESSASTESSSDTESRSSTPSVSAGRKNQIVNADGVVLAEDDLIDSTDTEAEAKLNKYLDDNNVAAMAEAMSTDQYAADIYAQGNTIVYEMTITTELNETQKQSLRDYCTTNQSSLQTSAEQGQAETGIDNMAMVISYVTEDGEIIANMVCG